MALLSFMARLGLDATGFEKNMAKADSQVSRFGTQTLGALKGQLAAAFSFAAINAGIHSAVENASKLNDQTARLGVGTKFFQEWAFGAKLAGSSSEELASFLEKLSVARTKALGGGASENKAFEQFGVSLDELKSGSLEGIASKVAKVFETGNPQKFIESLRTIGGRGAGGLISAFSDGMDDSAKKAQELGLVISDETIQALDDLGDRFDIMAIKSTGFWSKVGVGAVNAIDWLSKLVEKSTQASIQFYRAKEQSSGTFSGLRAGASAAATGWSETSKDQVIEDAEIKKILERRRLARLAKVDMSSIKSAAKNDIEASQFQSSASKSVSSLGGYYLGGDATAGMDLARQALELAKRTADDTKRSADRLDAIDAKITSLE